MDKITNEEVVVSIFYERLPTFCHFCGFIGHKKERCPLPEEMKKMRYGDELGIPPTHQDDPRCWYLPDMMGQTRHQHQSALSWRNNHQAIVAHVTNEVGKLTVQENKRNDKGEKVVSPSASVGSKQVLDGETEGGIAVNNNNTLPPKKAEGSWKRKPRCEEEVQSKKKETLTTQALILVAPRAREEEMDDQNMFPAAKKHMMQVPSLVDCLGEENLRRLRELENEGSIDRIPVAGKGSTLVSDQLSNESIDIIADTKGAPPVIGDKFREVSEGGGRRSADKAEQVELGTKAETSAMMEHGKKVDKEATGHGAADKLSGANEGAWQEQ
jgi:hypothetical protein